MAVENEKLIYRELVREFVKLDQEGLTSEQIAEKLKNKARSEESLKLAFLNISTSEIRQKVGSLPKVALCLGLLFPLLSCIGIIKTYLYGGDDLYTTNTSIFIHFGGLTAWLVLAKGVWKKNYLSLKLSAFLLVLYLFHSLMILGQGYQAYTTHGGKFNPLLPGLFVFIIYLIALILFLISMKRWRTIPLPKIYHNEG